MYPFNIITIMLRQRKSLQTSIDAFRILQKVTMSYVDLMDSLTGATPEKFDMRYWVVSGVS